MAVAAKVQFECIYDPERHFTDRSFLKTDMDYSMGQRGTSEKGFLPTGSLWLETTLCPECRGGSNGSGPCKKCDGKGFISRLLEIKGMVGTKQKFKEWHTPARLWDIIARSDNRHYYRKFKRVIDLFPSGQYHYITEFTSLDPTIDGI